VLKYVTAKLAFGELLTAFAFILHANPLMIARHLRTSNVLDIYELLQILRFGFPK
jgi:hypothetical protein